MLCAQVQVLFFKHLLSFIIIMHIMSKCYQK